MPTCCGSREAINITVASAEGPAMSGTARGTINGSPPAPRAGIPKIPSGEANTMRVAIMKRITPPAMAKADGVSCITSSTCLPPTMNTRRITKAMAHSRTTIARRRRGG